MGTKTGGIKAAKKNRKNDPAFYARIGAMGGRKSRGGGFTNRELASRAGKIGGAISRRRTLVAA